MQSAMFYGVSCCRFVFTRSTKAKQWSGVNRIVLMEKSNVYSAETRERHFSVLTSTGSRCVLNPSTKKILCQNNNDLAVVCLPRFSIHVRGYKIRKFQRKTLNMGHVLMPDFPCFMIPPFRHFLLPYTNSMIKGAKNPTATSVDQDFDFEDFLLNANKGLFTIANLITSRKVEELEDLLTPKAYRQVILNQEKLSPEHYSVLRAINQKSPTVVFQFNDTEVELSVSKDVSEVLAKLKLMVMFLHVCHENGKLSEAAVNVGGFERVYTSNLNDSTWSKGEEFDMKRIQQTGLAALDFKSDDYWRIYGVTFGIMTNKDYKACFV